MRLKRIMANMRLHETERQHVVSETNRTSDREDIGQLGSWAPGQHAWFSCGRLVTPGFQRRSSLKISEGIVSAQCTQMHPAAAAYNRFRFPLENG